MTTRQVTLSLSVSHRRPYVTSLYTNRFDPIASQIARQIRRYGERHGVAVSAVDYELAWGAR